MLRRLCASHIMTSGDVKYWIGFNLVTGIGPVRVRSLVQTFGSIEAAWKAPAEELRKAGLGEKLVQRLVEARSDLDLGNELARVQQLGLQVLPMDDPQYPARLKEIESPPLVLYLSGQLLPQDEWAAAIVGTRRATPYGKAVAAELAGGLAASGVTVVSGLARGIDGIAHQAALEAGGRTLAVLGSGLDHIYPPEHRNLARSIASSGAVLSDYPLGTSPEGGNFPARNRIIAGLSLAVIVVEAGESSGALITADFAAEQGRDVFAVPGRIYDRGSLGTNRLIAAGAFPVTTVDDVLEVLNLESVAAAAPREPSLPKDATERRVLEALSADPVHIDELRERCELPIAELTACLSMLELRGQARQVGGMHYVRAHEPKAAYRVG
jgi:DNA processing protein